MRSYLLSAVIAALVAAGTVLFLPRPTDTTTAATPAETSYDRVMRTGVLRCGYINYPPHFIIDPNTGAKSGISYDIANEMGRLLDLKIEWTEELGWGTTVEAIKSGRMDAICTSFWQNPVEGRYLGFTIPLFYSAVGAYVRADDEKLQSLTDINASSVRVATSDGDISFFIQKQDFPAAQVMELPNMTDASQLLLNVSTGKADVTFVETYLGEKFNAANNHTLKNLAQAHPVRLFGNTFAIPFDDDRLKSMLDSALVQMRDGTTIDRIISKYEEVPNGIYRTAPPYIAPKE